MGVDVHLRVATPLYSCLEMFLSLHFLLIQDLVSTVQVGHQGTSATGLTGSTRRAPVVHVVLLSHEERSHTLLW